MIKAFGNPVPRYIHIDEEKHTISFTIQEGPIKEVGVNGCQIEDVIESVKEFLEVANIAISCRENKMAIMKLDESLLWLMKRRIDREKRGVEGKML
jgi:hypothetical protein